MSNQNEKSAKGGKGGKIVLAICIVVIIALLGVVIFLLLNKGEKEEPVKRNVVVNKDNVDEIVSQMIEKEITEQGYYEATMNSTWNFEDGSAISEDAYVKNAETNQNSVYFDVTLADTNATIYESPIIPVGSYLDNIALGSDLNAGSYDCIVTYHLLNESDESISTVRVSLTIVIAN